ncbi:pregnancy-specific beta-1-glycoprotein 1 [Lates calcarifer]|uniref:Pregnancy-specific beta-1-glycoprotein 1 n=1 Tax=Lates calcarifer TaxID=8187 RepID=A0AAJ8DUS5_LATCA|nr:pregnancy-specific beta-1-glycoprotein 1 [Lates calcarifer]
MGDALNLTCSVDSFPASDITWTKSGSDKILPAVQKHSGSVSLIIQDVTVNDFGQYNCTAKHLGNTLVEKVDVTLYVEKPVITGMTTVQEGDALHLTCSVDSSHPSDITWTKLGSNKNLQKETKVILHKDAGIASLFISNVTAEHSGQYICTAKHEIINVTVQSEVTVTYHHGLSVAPFLTVAVISLIVNVAFIIYFVFLCNSRKKVKPNEEDRTYMSLQKTDTSPVYDVIGQPLN